MGPRAGVNGAENLAPSGIRSPDRPARGELLYRLSYRDPPPFYISNLNVSTINNAVSTVVIVSCCGRKLDGRQNQSFVPSVGSCCVMGTAFTAMSRTDW